MSIAIEESRATRPHYDWRSLLSSPLFLPALVFLIGMGVAFQALILKLPGIWAGNEYYSHGFLVPFISGYIVYRAWPEIKDTKVGAAWWGTLPLLVGMLIYYAGAVADVTVAQCAGFIVSLESAVLIVAGFRWFQKLGFPVLYLATSLPILGPFIEEYTNPMQALSATMAAKLLTIFGVGTTFGDATTIYLNRYVLNVGIPCSGLKLIVALFAFVFFFIMIARLRWWANALLVLMTFPLAVLMNGLRIAMIGVVGDSWGSDAGAQFHDYSGYLTLVICFFILFKGVKLLGWKG